MRPGATIHLSDHASTEYLHQLVGDGFIIQSSSTWACILVPQRLIKMRPLWLRLRQQQQCRDPGSGSDGGSDWVPTDPSAQSLSFLWFLPNLEIRKKYVINSFLPGTEKL